MEIKVGDLVKYKGNNVLHSGAEVYPYAVVVSTNPMVLVSKECDMRWQSTVKVNELEVIGKANTEELMNCFKRL